MSFILDALRKSEHERQRRLLPGLVEAPRAAPRSHRGTLLLVGVGGLLLLNTLLVAYLLYQRTPTPSAPRPTPAGVAPRPAPRPNTQHSDVRPLRGENEPDEAPFRDVPPTPVARVAMPNAPSHPASSYAVTSPPATSDAGPAPPSLRQLPATVAGSASNLHLDLHVYAADPQQRFVIISGQRAREGGSLEGGIVVEQITPDGVNLNQRGTRFHLGRD
jgi:general secretion pathway protein B